jgi:hypothetical protein
VVNDGDLDSSADTVTINYSPSNQAPIANAGSDQAATTGNEVTLDGSGSSDNDSDPITYSWSFDTQPASSSASLTNASSVNPRFTPDEAGEYIVELIVNDGMENSAADTASIQASTSGSEVDTFNGSGALTGFVTNNPSSLPDTSQTSGRYRANLTDNSGDITLHFNNDQGRLDAWLTRFPFEYIARNIGIGTQGNSQIAHPYEDFAYNFSGIQVHVPDLSSRNSSHMVVGHRGTDDTFTIEGKNTFNGSSQQNSNGTNTVPNTRADLRVVGGSNGSLTFYWQLPNPNPGVAADDWTPYGGTGKMPGTEPNYGSSGSQVYVGLITYAFGTKGLPFVGTCDSIELIEN